MGVFLECRDLRIGGETVGIKVLLPGLASDLASRVRFENEARIGKMLSQPPRGSDGRKRKQCPNIVNVDRLGQLDDGNFFFVMGFVSGRSLANYMKRPGGRGNVLPPEEALPVAISVLDGLAYAHWRGVTHRDIKPQNILLAEDEYEGERVAKLIDFGVAILKGEPARGFAGTLQYAAPEQLLCREVDGKADVYALFVVLFEMLTGCLPWPVIPQTDDLLKDLKATLETRRQPRKLADYGVFPSGLQSLLDDGLALDPHGRPDATEAIDLIGEVRRNHFSDARDPQHALTREAPRSSQKHEIEPDDINLTVPAAPPAAALLNYDDAGDLPPPASSPSREGSAPPPSISTRPALPSGDAPDEPPEFHVHEVRGGGETAPMTPMPTRLPPASSSRLLSRASNGAASAPLQYVAPADVSPVVAAVDEGGASPEAGRRGVVVASEVPAAFPSAAAADLDLPRIVPSPILSVVQSAPEGPLETALAASESVLPSEAMRPSSSLHPRGGTEPLALADPSKLEAALALGRRQQEMETEARAAADLARKIAEADRDAQRAIAESEMSVSERERRALAARIAAADHEALLIRIADDMKNGTAVLAEQDDGPRPIAAPRPNTSLAPRGPAARPTPDPPAVSRSSPALPLYEPPVVRARVAPQRREQPTTEVITPARVRFRWRAQAFLRTAIGQMIVFGLAFAVVVAVLALTYRFVRPPGN
ncbi:hypothetical protein BH11MYX4_BH11MYX4_23150 [soil metagenome]